MLWSNVKTTNRRDSSYIGLERVLALALGCQCLNILEPVLLLFYLIRITDDFKSTLFRLLS
jgi:hypothetical protein